MTLRTTLSPELTLDILAITPDDHSAALSLLAESETPAVARATAFLTERLGSHDASVPDFSHDTPVVTELDWLSAMMRFVPTILQWHAERSIPESISRDTLADFGRNLSINRRVHGQFGMDTYKWLLHHFAGRIFQLGRLQYLLHQPEARIPGVEHGEWILGIHIPEDGGLSAPVVDASLAQAAPFFAAHFPEYPVRIANCESWLLDPYLAARLDPSSNIAAFAARFTAYAEPRTEPTDAVYFTFRTRSMENLGSLPRTTALQRIVLERIDGGGAWALGFGALQLPR